MKIQMTLDLGEMLWSAKNPLSPQGSPCCCLEQGKLVCECVPDKTFQRCTVTLKSEKAEGELAPEGATESCC